MKVHDDTHRALKALKARQRGRSIDQVIRRMIRETTGSPVESARDDGEVAELTGYLED